MRTVMAPGWVEKLQQQAHDDSGLPWGGDQAVAIFGVPGSGTCQCVITGFHLTMRATSQSQPLAAFGGPITHGNQPSGFYEKVGHPGNIFWYQALRANEVYRLLDDKQQARALISESVPLFQREGVIDRTTIMPDTPWDEPTARVRHSLPPSGNQFAGAPLGSDRQRTAPRSKRCWPASLNPISDRISDQVFDCLKRQGGLEQCSLAFYRRS